MREIKFNAVDEDTNEYFRYDDWLLDSYESGNSIIEYLASFFNDFFGCKLLQYTCLKAADGVEIYEGDLIQLYYITPFGDITDSLEEDIFEVKFLNGAFGYQNKTSFVPLEELIEKHSGEYVPNCGNKVIYGKMLCKVIGNVYENKDLL